MSSPSLIPPNPVATPLSQYWPILCKGQANRLTFFGPPTLEQYWHKSFEQGRWLESGLNEAMFAVQKEKSDIQRHIMHYLDLIQTSSDAEFGNPERRFKLAADIINYIEKIHAYMNDLQGLILAIQMNLQLLQTVEASMLAMVQNNLNALANFMQQICNLGLPPLPSIPSIFGTSIFSFNGFNLNALVPRNISFSQFSNFSFAQCTIVPPNTNIYAMPPVSFNFEGYTVGAVSGTFAAPLGGTVGDASQLANPQYATLMQATTDAPVYNPLTVNPATILQGSLPSPSQIISNYQMPSATYAANILSVATVAPALQVAVTNQETAELPKLLAEYVNIAGIVTSGYDRNLTATWLLYIQAARIGRSGNWLPNFQAAYQTYIAPSLTSLAANPVPWNTVLGGTGTVSAPSDIPLIDTLNALGPVASQNVLWKLSYIEASLLGYTRNETYDGAADNVYLSTFTGSDLDYAATNVTLTNTQTVILGQDTATFPVSCTFPSAIADVLNQVIAIATNNIASDPTYQTNRVQFLYTYDAFANVTTVDRYTQFWRTFNYNLQLLLAQDPYIVDFVVTYVASLDAAIDPLGNTADYLQIQNDALSRNRSWTPGQPLLPLPVPPVVEVGTLPGITGSTTGWTSSNFDPQNFLGRPDVQSLPLSTQLAMLRTNESYAAVMTYQSNMQDAIFSAQMQASAALVGLQNSGFSVVSSISLPVNTNATPATPVSFDQTAYDTSNYVESPTLFEIQVAGLYVVSAMVTWDKGPAGVRTLTLTQNTSTVLDQSQTQESTIGPVQQTVNIMQQFNVGDTIQVLASQTVGVLTDIIPGSTLSVLLVPSTDSNPQAIYTDTAPGSKPNAAPRNITAGVTMPAGVAVYIVNSGVLPIDPVGAVTTPFVDGIVTDPVVQGQLANVGTNYGSEYTITGQILHRMRSSTSDRAVSLLRTITLSSRKSHGLFSWA